MTTEKKAILASLPCFCLLFGFGNYIAWHAMQFYFSFPPALTYTPLYYLAILSFFCWPFVGIGAFKLIHFPQQAACMERIFVKLCVPAIVLIILSCPLFTLYYKQQLQQRGYLTCPPALDRLQRDIRYVIDPTMCQHPAASDW